MAVTHRKRLFARHFAKTADRQGAVAAAGYAMDSWARTATRLLQDEEVLALIEREQEKELRKFDTASIDDSYVLGEMIDLRDRIKACGMGSWQAQAETRILELLGKYRQLFSERMELGLDDDLMRILKEGRERARRLYVESQPPAALPPVIDAPEADSARSGDTLSEGETKQ